ncbi:MAG TPA: hypothetical protein VH619_16560 [Verrucomicrobiae bacterium]|jgi:hypothetical protein|nr:hypothetical protein [Verrucomicrobiae bacterium]
MLQTMTTLAEIEAAVDALPSSEKQHLLLYVAASLQAHGSPLPDSQALSHEQQRFDWMAEDESAMRRFRQNP